MRNPRPTHVSLCTGIGGLDLIFGAPTIAADINERTQKVIAKNWPETQLEADWTTWAKLPDSTTLVTAGLPCQPVSEAGKQLGLADPRWLFDDFCDLIVRSHARPTIFLENVAAVTQASFAPGLVSVFNRLRQIGYSIFTTTVAASSAGAPHRRSRWFALLMHPATCLPSLVENYNLRPQPARNPLFATLTTATGGGFTLPGGAEHSLRANSFTSYFRLNKPFRLSKSQQHNTPLFDSPPNGRFSTLVGDNRAIDWQEYRPTVEHWSEVLGRTPPAYVDGKHPHLMGSTLLEWFMGFPAGWVPPELKPTPTLIMLGNSVVPQQAFLAWQRLLVLSQSCLFA